MAERLSAQGLVLQELKEMNKVLQQIEKNTRPKTAKKATNKKAPKVEVK